VFFALASYREPGSARSDRKFAGGTSLTTGGQVSDVPTGTFTTVSAGGDHSCAFSTAGAITCWGSDDDGEVSGTP
jgi:hypothetical protein